jgi:DNA-binding MarR family transcriptional regulator/N-acetylglutamate synthase-like GNAT family acetyltransferase
MVDNEIWVPISSREASVMAQPATAVVQNIDAVRRFNRFYTRQIGVLREGLLDSPFSLTEVRVLYEIAHRNESNAAELCKDLNLDAGYLSRILRRFQQQHLLTKAPSASDGRQSLLALTVQGRKVFAPLEGRQSEEVGAMLAKLSPHVQRQLLEAMRTIQRLLDPNSAPQASYLLRFHQPGDMGWIVHRHGVLYSQEYGYDECFEALVAEIAAKFIQHFDPKRERCWIAEKDGGIVGCVFAVRKSTTVAKLRLLLVEPSARGLGIGSRLVSECVRFARQTGYKKLMLWTQSELLAARHLYEQAGFHLADRKRHESWGRKLVAETWALKL